MKKRIIKPTLTLDILGMKINVIRVGESPQLKKAEESSKSVRHIHSHFTYEVFFVTEGCLELIAEDEKRLYERKVVIIPPRLGHYTVPSQKGSFCLLFSFEQKKDDEKFGSDSILEFPLSDDVEYFIKALTRKSDENTENSEKCVELLSSLIFNELFTWLWGGGRKSELSKSESKHIGAIETYINANINKKITLEAVAEQVYLSTRQVSRILKKEYGCTLSQLVTDKKLASAKMLLKSTDLKISEIAEQVNIGGENYFYCVFKKKYGISPFQFRKQHCK